LTVRPAAPIAVVALLCLTACGGIQLDMQKPEGFDLTGTWMLVEDLSEPPPSNRRLRSRGGMLVFVIQDFPVLHAREMRIEPSGDSMGIRYVPGGYRDVSWGTRTRGLWEVRAGWHEGNLVILSVADDARARETLTLSEGGRRLDVAVRIDARGDDLDLVRVFRRRL
jgi:hypothetical protein